jgi:hypothetical protein
MRRERKGAGRLGPLAGAQKSAEQKVLEVAAEKQCSLIQASADE